MTLGVVGAVGSVLLCKACREGIDVIAFARSPQRTEEISKIGVVVVDVDRIVHLIRPRTVVIDKICDHIRDLELLIIATKSYSVPQILVKLSRCRDLDDLCGVCSKRFWWL